MRLHKLVTEQDILIQEQSENIVSVRTLADHWRTSFHIMWKKFQALQTSYEVTTPKGAE